MLSLKFFERSKNDIVTFAEFKFAAGENHKPISHETSSRPRRENIRIDALIAKMHRRDIESF